MIETLIGFYGAFLRMIEINSTLKSHLWWKFIKKPQIQLNLRHVKTFNQNSNLWLFDFRRNRNKALENPSENLWWIFDEKMWNREDFLEWKEKLIKQRFVILLMEFSDFSDSFLGRAFVGFPIFQISPQISIPQKNSSKNLWFNKTCFTFFSFHMFSNMFSKKDLTFIVFFFFVARIKFIQGNLENNEMYHSQILIYWQLCWRESP